MAKQVRCGWCSKKFWARNDAKWCSEKCRYEARALEAKITLEKIPKSGFQGITFSRLRRRWEARIKEEKIWKYIGSFKTLEAALRFQIEVTNELSFQLRVHRRENGKKHVLSLGEG
jgi:hypothetical protein